MRISDWSSDVCSSDLTAISADLMSHVRYPTDLLKVQRAMLGVYHVDDARSFIQQDNRWATPNDPQNADRLQPPYYLKMQLPGQDAPSYSTSAGASGRARVCQFG